MDRKVLFLDLDGTLTNDDKKVTPKTLKALKQIMEEGHIVALASGRPTPGVAQVAKTLELDKYGGYVLSFNGGKVINWKTKEVIYENALSKEYIPELVDYATGNKIGLITYDDDSIVVGTPIDEYIELESFINKLPLKEKNLVEYVDYNPNKCLLTAPGEIAAEHEKILSKKFEGRISIYRSEPFFIEALAIATPTCAYLIIVRSLNPSPQAMVFSFGIPRWLIRTSIECALSIPIGNATDVVKENADYITKSNNEDGIAHVIEKFILEK